MSKVCNKCSKEKDNLHFRKVEFPYLSKHSDQVAKFQICEECIDEILGGFAIQPKMSNIFDTIIEDTARDEEYIKSVDRVFNLK